MIGSVNIPGIRSTRRVALVAVFATLAGCSIFVPQPQAPPPPPEPPKPQYAEPLATHTFPFDPQTTAVVGTLQVTIATHEDTLPDIARRFNLGYDEVVRANPGVDPWLPGEGTRIVLPTQFVLPDAPREGLVVNLAALRIYYFPKPAKGEQRVVVTLPIGIGKVGWATPEGATKIVSKRKDPVWTPPASVRKEHAAEGDILPARVPAGPDNPLGAFAMNLGWPSYLMHGTNKPAGVGMRASHGCIRLYPEDIATLFHSCRSAPRSRSSTSRCSTRCRTASSTCSRSRRTRSIRKRKRRPRASASTRKCRKRWRSARNRRPSRSTGRSWSRW